MQGNKYDLHISRLRNIQIAIIWGSNTIVRPMIVAIIAIYPSRNVSEHQSILVLHFQEVAVPPTHFLVNRDQT